jgi:hypothetical protein
MPHRRALVALALLAACSQVPPPTSAAHPGRGEVEVRAVETTGRTGRIVLGLTQGSIRACSGSYEPYGPASPVRTTELACTGGITGTATVGPDPAGGRSVRWALETGESGRSRL